MTIIYEWQGLIMYKFKTVGDAYNEARKYNKSESTSPFPPYITIELLNECNFRCSMCSLTYQDHKTVQFDLNKLKQVIDEIAEYGSMVRFIGYCEPLMYEHIKDAVNYVKSKGLLLHMTTNASMLDKGMSEFLVEAGLDSIIFSFQGGSKDEYIAMRNLSAPMYEKVIENIKYLYSIKKRLTDEAYNYCH